MIGKQFTAIGIISMEYIKKGLMVLLLGTTTWAWGGQTVPVPDVAPAAKGWQVVINVPQQRLFLYQDGKLNKVYPVAVGKLNTQTNLGEHTIGAKAFNPTWHIPKSIQRERGDGVKTVPPGPNNPLGPVFVRLGDPKLGLGIHGTNNPSSVPGVRSHGCVRMKSPDALEFARTISTGSPAMVSYEMAALNVDAAGQLWLAAFGDPYQKNNLPVARLKQSINEWAKQNGKKIDMTKVEQIIKARTGRAVCLTCRQANAKIQGDLKSLAWNSGTARLTTVKTNPLLKKPAEPFEETGNGVMVDVGELPPATTFEPQVQTHSVFE